MKIALIIIITALLISIISVAGVLHAEDSSNLLQNQSFEDGTTGWQAYGGTLLQVASPVHDGSFAAAFETEPPRAYCIYQVVHIVPGEFCTFRGWALSDAPEIFTKVYLQVSWYESEDGVGEELGQPDISSGVLTLNSSDYQLLTVAANAPATAHSARVQAMVEVYSLTPFVTEYFDDFSITGPAFVPTTTRLQRQPLRRPRQRPLKLRHRQHLNPHRPPRAHQPQLLPRR